MFQKNINIPLKLWHSGSFGMFSIVIESSTISFPFVLSIFNKLITHLQKLNDILKLFLDFHSLVTMSYVQTFFSIQTFCTVNSWVLNLDLQWNMDLKHSFALWCLKGLALSQWLKGCERADKNRALMYRWKNLRSTNLETPKARLFISNWCKLPSDWLSQ